MSSFVRPLLAVGLAFLAGAGLAADRNRAPGEVATAPTVPVDCTEGFEGDLMPPPGWRIVQSSAYTWKIQVTGQPPHSGAHAADVEYDPDLYPQDEWLLTPKSRYTGTLTFWSQGSLYWCRDTYDNCDLEVWLVQGAVAGDDDDVYLGLADPAWPSPYAWAQSSFVVGASAPAGLFRIGFRYTGLDGAQIVLDDIVHPAPCPVFGADWEAGDLLEWDVRVP